MRLLILFAAARAAREPQSADYGWDWQFPNLREQAANAFRPIQKLTAPDTPFIERLPDGVASRAIATDDGPANGAGDGAADGAASFVESEYRPPLGGRGGGIPQYRDKARSLPTVQGEMDLPEEMSDGAPTDGFRDCALKGESCHCDSGQVRYGARACTVEASNAGRCTHLDEWTHPNKVGEKTARLKCDLATLKEYRMYFPPEDGSPTPTSCQCLQRDVTIQIDMGRASSGKWVASLLEQTHNETQFMQVQNKVAHEMDCLQAGGFLESMLEVRDSALVERDEMMSSSTGGKDMSAVIKPCATDDERSQGAPDDEKFIFFKSTGQLKHFHTGKCLTADFVTAVPRVSLKDCTLRESQHHIQRWDLPFYEMPNFVTGKGYIKLGYGGHKRNAWCLTVTAQVADLVQCVGAASVQWTVKAIEQNTGGHQWKDCASEGEQCICPNGEVRYGDADASEWTPGVPVDKDRTGKSGAVCSLDGLRDLAVQDPISDATGTVKCQCRHDAYVDGDENPHTARSETWLEANEFERDHAPGMVSEAKMWIMSGAVGGGALLIGICVGAFMYYKWKQKQDYGEEEWFDEEEEEYEYEEEEDY